MVEAWRPRSPASGRSSTSPSGCERRLLDAQLMWVWLCTWWLLPRLPDPESAGRDAPIGPDAARSPRISTALAHYWRELGAGGGRAGRGATAELAAAVVAALRRAVPRRAGRARGLPRPAARWPDGRRGSSGGRAAVGAAGRETGLDQRDVGAGAGRGRRTSPRRRARARLLQAIAGRRQRSGAGRSPGTAVRGIRSSVLWWVVRGPSRRGWRSTRLADPARRNRRVVPLAASR